MPGFPGKSNTFHRQGKPDSAGPAAFHTRALADRSPVRCGAKRREARPEGSGRASRQWKGDVRDGARRQAGTFQMSLAYSRIERSEENQAMRAVLRTAFSPQDAWSPHRASIRRWVFQ